MYSLRVIRTSSKASAVQVVWYEYRKVKIAAHIGSAHDAMELETLKKAGAQWIAEHSNQDQLALFSPSRNDIFTPTFSLENCQLVGIGYSFIYSCLTQLFNQFSFDKLNDRMLFDLALIRIIEPASKLRSFELLSDLFGISYSYRELSRHLPGFTKHKDTVENMVLEVAKSELDFDFTLVFYDVTTLYFESFGEDELRKPGFSKDGKPSQPQILIGLIVNKEGFPVAYQVFEGNTFEGHTIIPVIMGFKLRHSIQSLTVVADAGMISLDNTTKLKGSGLSYIVGARLAGLPATTIESINARLKQEDGATVLIETANGHLICDFSLKRYHKDKREMEKQIAKAEALLKSPGKMKRAKFVSSAKKGNPELMLNDLLIKRTTSLLGIKGYFTNLENLSNQEIIKQYYNLWQVEHAFRIAKNDLQTRPVYHFKKETVEAHILICFMALVIAKYMELKTGKSIKRIIRELKRVADAKVLDQTSGKVTTMRSVIPKEVQDIVDKLGLKISVILMS